MESLLPDLEMLRLRRSFLKRRGPGVGGAEDSKDADECMTRGRALNGGRECVGEGSGVATLFEEDDGF